METITRLLGRDLTEWMEIDAVLQEQGIKNARELASRLGMRDALSRTVRVVDSKNPKRVLGSVRLRREHALREGNCFKVAIRPSLFPCDYRPGYCPSPDASFSVVRFDIERETQDGGWTYTPFLTTDSPLADLMKVEDFRLPDETESEWHRRWMRR